MRTATIFRYLTVLVLGALSLGAGLPGFAADLVSPIPPGPETTLPDYAGAPVKAHPIANTGIPQNALLAPNGLNSVHLDPWMSDSTDIAGSLGRNPTVLDSSLASVRSPDPSDEVPWIFVCITQLIDSHGRVIAICFAPHEATVVLADPDTLQVLSHYHLEVPVGDPYKSSGRQEFMRSMGSVYSFLDARDELNIVSGGKKIVTLVEVETADGVTLELSKTYDLTPLIPTPGDDLTGNMLDWQGRIWVTTAGTGGPARVGVINRAKSTAEGPSVKWLLFPSDEVIRNTFAVTKAGVDRTAAYIVTSLHLYRIEAGPDDQPQVVWSEPYDTVPYDTNDEHYVNGTKNGQYELGSGTSPTVLGEGKYVAITGNAVPMKVVVYRTDASLDPNEARKVCEVPVFENSPGALSNSLVGSRLSLIATNNYDYLWDWHTGNLVEPSAPGAERIDISPNGKGCTKVWTNATLATTWSPRLSTKTGLIYTIGREYDAQNDLYVYYWAALDFRTGQTVWKKLAGTGDRFDTFYPGLVIGQDGAIYSGVYGGLTMMKDTP